MKALETVYKGYRFRSRLEARWAVFFDAMGIAYEYEKQGYDLDELGWYLPDFWLRDGEVWVEIKPAGDQEHSKMAAAISKGKRLAEYTDSKFLLLAGNPYPGEYTAHYHAASRMPPWEVWSGELAVCRKCAGLWVLHGDEGASCVYCEGGCRAVEKMKWPVGAEHSDTMAAGFEAARQERF